LPTRKEGLQRGRRGKLIREGPRSALHAFLGIPLTGRQRRLRRRDRSSDGCYEWGMSAVRGGVCSTEVGTGLSRGEDRLIQLYKINQLSVVNYSSRMGETRFGEKGRSRFDQEKKSGKSGGKGTSISVTTLKKGVGGGGNTGRRAESTREGRGGQQKKGGKSWGGKSV